MPSAKQWEEEEGNESSGSESGSGSGSDAAPAAGVVRRTKFDDEEGDDSDVIDSWDAAEDSEAEREKAKKAAEAKAKADAEAKANKKSKAQRIAEHQAERARAQDESDEEDEDEDEAEKRERMRRQEKEADMRHAEDLFGEVGISNNRKTNTKGRAVQIDASDPNKTVDLASLPIFNPSTKTQFEQLREVLVPIIAASTKKAHYALFLQEFTKQLAKDLPSEQIKKMASALTTLSNEKMRQEKAADKTTKKSKAQKTKTALAGVSRNGGAADVNSYDADAGFGDDDFM